jgi:histidinol dehydrogenase
MRVVAASDSAAFEAISAAGWDPNEAVGVEVAQIIADVRDRGDAAVIEANRRFDGTNETASTLRQTVPPLHALRETIPPEIAAALELEMDRLSRVHQRQRLANITQVDEDGTRYALLRRAFRSVAVYAPQQGAAVAALMGAVPAKIAGVERIVVLSPARRDGISSSLLFACALCGVEELYVAGGAQAIAAAAFGTASLPAVDKIVGRGGLWTTEAKRQVFGRCGIDMLAGPAEILVVADDGANSEYVVEELLSAAEQSAAARFAVVSESRSLLDAVAQLIDSLDLQSLDNATVSAAIGQRCRLILCNDGNEVFGVIDRFAPAYLCLHVRDAWAYLDRISRAAIVYIGDSTPLVAGAYLAGINGVAPTSGGARFASALSLSDFVHSISVVENSAQRIAGDASALAALSESDGLAHHAQAARMRGGT